MAIILGALMLPVGLAVARPGPPGDSGTKYDEVGDAIGSNNSAAFLFLKIISSPRANSMGGSSINLVDEHAALYNPGAIGLFHLDKVLSVTIPSKTDWLPTLAFNLKLETFGASGGISLATLGHKENRPFNLSLGIAYHRHRLDYGGFAQIDTISSEIIDYFNVYDEASYYSVGLGFQYGKFWRIGAGYSYKKIESHLGPSSDPTYHAEASAYDLGFITEFALAALVPHEISLKNSSKYKMNFQITPSAAFVMANRGDDARYGLDDSTTPDPLPKTDKTGLGLFLAANVNDAALFSCRLLTETEKDVYDNNHPTHRSGCEFALFESFFYRLGKFNNRLIDDCDVHTWGAGFSLGGVISWLDNLGYLNIDNGLTGRLIRSLDIRIDYAKYEPGLTTMPIWRTTFFKASLSL
jgi:hypothetical protein